MSFGCRDFKVFVEKNKNKNKKTGEITGGECSDGSLYSLLGKEVYRRPDPVSNVRNRWSSLKLT